MNLPEPERRVFKKCPMCGFAWESRSSFLVDPDNEIIGYQACFTALTTGFFLFNHSCTGTLAILVEQFRDLYDGPVYETRKTGMDECPGYCLHKDELARCPQRCECAFVREIIQIVREWPKGPSTHLRPLRT
ncbi:MAG: hypothetical protein AB1716_06600 [Planctomycetota bacterium]